MVQNKQKKNLRQRGYSRHGWGARKKRRGAGNRGGRGMAGSGKRADQKKPSILKYYGLGYFGKKGFKRGGAKTKTSINIAFIEQHLDMFDVKETAGAYVIDLSSKGFDKLLGSGIVTKKFKITAKEASKKAIEKVKSAGGEVVLQQESKVVEKKEE